jgi:hypothetical protein
MSESQPTPGSNCLTDQPQYLEEAAHGAGNRIPTSPSLPVRHSALQERGTSREGE